MKKCCLIFVFLFMLSSFVAGEDFIRGDANNDGIIDVSDPVYMLNYLFQGRGRILCFDAADVNDDGLVDVSDAVYLLNKLFLGGSEIPAPYPNAGEDITADGLSCK